jgi:NADPH:quinone reductase-like Zn-dependent oxidoreductase
LLLRPKDALAPKPANLTFEPAAAVPLAGSVALQALRGHADVQPVQKVLVNGASGGIGTFAVQIAKSLGAEVTGVCSTPNTDLLRSIGVAHVIDYIHEDFTKNGQRYDLILDNANRSLSDLRRAVTPAGMVIPNGGGFDNRCFASAGRLIRARVLSLFVKPTLRTFLVAKKREDLIMLREMIEAGTITPVIGRIHPLTETAEAMADVGSGHARGRPSSGWASESSIADTERCRGGRTLRSP